MHWTKQQTAEFLGWTEKTLDRKTAGTELGNRLGRAGGKGTGSHVIFSETQVRIFKAQMDNRPEAVNSGENINDESTEFLSEIFEPQMSDKLDIAENQNLQIQDKSIKSDVSENRKLDIAVNPFEILLLPHKLYLTLDEAKKLTGFPKTEIRKNSELKFGRRCISIENLKKM